jgi:peptidoglycan/xylan/chitin deacetylase (PgdA/CDA1 family)
MRLLSPLLRQVVYPTLRSTGFFRANNSSFPAVITYHGVVPEGYNVNNDIPDGPLLKAETFRRQLRILKQNYNPISPDQFLAWIKHKELLPRRAVLVTCDDGLLNHCSDMLPILWEERMQCLFFVTAASLSEAPGMLWYVELYLSLAEAQRSRLSFSFNGELWDVPLGDRSQRRGVWLELLKRLSKYDGVSRKLWLQQAQVELGVANLSDRFLGDPRWRLRFALMGRHELCELLKARMTIGAHTLSHPLLAEQPRSYAEAEVRDSQRVLSETLGAAVWAMAYPFGYRGSAAEREFALVEAAGYECAFMNCGAQVGSDSSRFAWPRVHITAEMGLSEFEAHVSGFHSRLQRSVGRA